MKLKIIEIVKNNIAKLIMISAENAYYNLEVGTEEGLDIYRLIIPLSDIGTTTLKSQEKCIVLMRWIRKAMENKELIKIKELKFEKI